MIKSAFFVCGLAVGIAAPSLAAAQMRTAPAHVHGASTMTIVSVGNKYEVELNAPAHDIVGFERSPASDEDIALVETAKARLSDYSVLLGALTPACEVLANEIVFSADAHDHDHDHDHDEIDADAHGNGHDDHAEFSVTFSLECPSQIAAIDAAGYFASFPRAQSLTVQGIIDGKALQETLTPPAPSLPLN